MPTIAELYGEEPTPKRKNPLRRRRTIADLYGETSDETQSKSSENSTLDSITRLLRPGGVAVEFAKSPLGEFLLGAVEETAGNALETLGDPDKTLAARYSPWMRNLKGAGETLNEAADSTLADAAKRVTVDDYDTVAGAGKNAFGSQGYGSLGGLFGMIHSDKSANALMDASAALENRNRVSTDDGYLEYFTNPRGLLSDFAGLAGSMATIAPTMFLLPEATIARGLYGLGGSVLERFLINRGLIGGAKYLAQTAPNIARYALTSAPTESAMEGGQARYDALRQGLSPEEADRRAAEVFKYNLPLLGGSNAFEAALMFSPFSSKMQKLLGRFGRLSTPMQIGGRALFGSGQQQFEEANQQGIQDFVAGKEGDEFRLWPLYSTPSREAARDPVKIAGAIPGGLGGIFHAFNRDEISDSEYTDNALKAGENQRVRNNVNTKELRSWANKHSGGRMSDDVFNEIIRTADKFGLPRERLLATALAESKGDQNVTSPVGAIGVMQLMPETAQALGVDPHDTNQNILGGAMYLKQMYDKFGNWGLAHAAYNAGGGAVEKYGGIPPYRETQNYVAEINRYLGDHSPAQSNSQQDDAQPRGGNIFGTENYDMPLWGSPNVSSLKAGWSEILPQIGGVLKSMGFDPVITSGGRTREHQMAINPSAPNSHHIIRDYGGDAVDISLAEGGVTPEQSQKVLDFLDSTGLFQEVLYHDAGSGLHLHIGGLNTENLGKTYSAPTEQKNSYDPDFSPRQNEIWQWAQYAAKRLRDEYQINIPPELIYKQWCVEDGGDFTHPSKNWGGLTQSAPTPYPMQGGGAYFSVFNSDKEYADAYVDKFMALRPEFNGVTNEEEFARAGLATGYMTQEDFDNGIGYPAKMRGVPVPKTGYSNPQGGKTSPPRQSTQSSEPIQIEPIQPPESSKTPDIKVEDEKLFERFANEKYNPTNGNADPNDLDFFSSMFDGDKFINTQENRDEIRDFYGEDFTNWAQNVTAQEQTQPQAQPTQAAPKPQTQSTTPIKSTKSQSTAQTQTQPIQPTAQTSPTAQVATTTQSNETPQAQPTQDPVSQNKPPNQNQPETQSTTTKINGTDGNSAQVLTDNRTPYAVKYKVVEADDLNVSHDINPTTSDVEVNKNYPAELQPRDRERAGYRDRVLNMGANLDPTQLMDSENVNQGAPVIRSDGVILNGNGRAMAIRRAQATGNADGYRNAILENAERLGLNKDEIAAMKNPVLVRKVEGDLSGEALTNITQSRQGGMQLGAVEQAREDAKKLTSQILSRAPDDGDLTKAGSRQFLIDAVRAISTPEELNAMTSADGGVTDAGVRRVRNALFTAAFGDNQTLANLAETSETEGNAVKSVTNALTATAAKFARIRAESEKGNLPQVDLSPIIQAVEKLAALRDRGTPVLKDLTQETLPGFETESEEAKDLLGFFDGHKRRPQDITAFMHALADGILSKASNSGDLFGGAPKSISLAKAIANARQQVEGNDLTQEMLQHKPTFNAIAERMHKRLQTRKDKSLKHLVNRLLENARDGDDQSLRTLNRLKGDPTETSLFNTTEENPNQDAESQQAPPQVNSDPKVETDAAPESKSGTKFDREGEKGKLEHVLSDDQLTPVQKAIQAFCAKMGVKVKFFDSHSDARGAFEDGVVYININSKAAPDRVFFHELGHWLAVNEPQLFNQLVKLLNISDAQRQAYRDRVKNPNLTDDEVDAEILCDLFGDEGKRLGLLKDANKENPSLVEKFIAWLKNVADKFVDFMFKPENGLTRSQRNRLYDSVGKLATAIVDAHGNKKYRYNRNTHTLEYVDGTPIETLPLTKANDPNGTKWSRAESENSSEPEQVDESNPKTWRDTPAGKFFMKAVDKFKRALHIKGDRIISAEDQRQAKIAEAKSVLEAYIKNPSKENRKRLREADLNQNHVKDYINQNLFNDGIGFFKNWIPSPSRIADKVQVFRSFFRMGDRALRKQIQSRGKFVRRYNRIMDIVAKKDDRENLFGLLWKGDFDGQEFGKLSDKELDTAKTSRRDGESETQAIQRVKIEKICREQDVSENVARAYLEVRKMLRALGTEINKARRHPQTQSRFLSDAQIEDLKGNKFVEIKQIGDKRDESGKRLVRYTEFENRERTLPVTPETLKKLEKDDAIQILDQSGFNDGRALVRFREGIPEFNPDKEKGYIPHFFHEYSVEVRDKTGKKVGKTLFTAQTERDAVKLAEEWKKSNTLKDGENIYITPRGLARELGLDAEKLAPVIGDNDFAKMTARIAQLHDMTLEEAKKFLEDTTQFKKRHRFLGNLVDRKGAAGFEQNMDWVLRHYINVGTRYVAMESEFLPQAITQFEKLFGAFDNDYSRNLTAQYVKEYIQDVNGNPTRVEEIMNKALNKTEFYRTWIAATYGNRGWLTATDATIRFVSYMKLGFFNLSSAMLNLTQLINAGGLLGGYGKLGKHFGKIVAQGGKLTQKQLRILTESGVINDLGLDTNSAYDKHRVSLFGDASTFDKVDNALNKTMVIFQTMDTLCRAATTLAAYEQATAQGKSKADALEYAADINRKANFDYSVTDAPNLFRRFGPLGKLVLQFQKYPVKQLELLWDMHPLNSKTSRAQKIAFWFPYIFVCGLMGAPPLFDQLDKIANKFGFFPKDFLEECVIKGSQKFLPEDIAKDVSRAVLYGGGALANVDMSSRAGLAGFLDNDLKGATLSTIVNTAENLAKGEKANALRSLSPGLYNYLAAYEGETHGRRGRTNDVYDFWGRLRRAFGFRSADEAAIVDAERIERNRQGQKYDERHKAIDAYIDDPSDENAERCAELGIRASDIRREMRKKEQTREGRFWDNISKKDRPDYQYFEDFVDDD